VATIEELRDRSEALFTQLLQAQARPATPRPRRRGRTALAAAGDQPAPSFSWFDPEDAIAAAALSFQLAAFAASSPEVEDGLESALAHVESEVDRAHPELLRQGLALFVTHNRDGRRLRKPRTVAAAPELFSPPEVRGGRPVARISLGGLSPGLDYWREDPLANEHHQHWHEVYPFTGLKPRDFRQWVTERSREELVAILDALEPNPQWEEIVGSSTTEALAGEFARRAKDRSIRTLPAALYRKIFRLNDRQGELFFYMHQQMLARYDAELLSNGRDRVEPFGPSEWDKPIAAGHDPIEVTGFGRREPDETLLAEDVQLLRSLAAEIDEALASKRLRARGGGTVAIDRTTFGEAVEGTITQLRELDPRSYRGLHNQGHGAIAALANPDGVMTSTVTAIRDQVFWQWHKYIDDLNAAWQDDLEPYDFADRPAVLLRNGLDPAADTAWASPDIILCRTSELPQGVDLDRLGAELFGGERWGSDFTAASVTTNGTSFRTIDELITTMVTVRFRDSTRLHLMHESFSYFVRIENKATTPLDVTVRVFLAPADHTSDRRIWMEMDKFLLRLPAREKVVAHRPDTESSIVKRPIDKSPADVQPGGGDPNAYCDCGWPYTLLLPRGTEQGMPFRLLALCTDAAIDRVDPPATCGSMSYCGAVERYPDTRDMGYPFCRPFGPGADAIRDRVVELPNAAARTVTIRHV